MLLTNLLAEWEAVDLDPDATTKGFDLYRNGQFVQHFHTREGITIFVGYHDAGTVRYVDGERRQRIEHPDS